MNNVNLHSLVPLILGFAVYFALHSWLASLWMKNLVAKQWPAFMPAYRLTFNLLAILLLLPLLWLMHANPGPLMWQWTGISAWIMKGLTIAAVAGFIWSLKAYDNMVFLGWRQWRQRHQTSEDPEQLHISTLHRFVRHPWYFFILVIIWAQDIHLAQLVTYGLITAYFAIGSRLEERKLIVHYGEAYREYCKKVPGLIPLPWRWLSREETNRLIAFAKKQNIP